MNTPDFEKTLMTRNLWNWPYKVSVRVDEQRRQDISTWIKSNCKGRYKMATFEWRTDSETDVWQFEIEQEALMFSLRWS